MKKIVNYVKNNYKIFIPIMVGVVLLITLFFLYREYEYDNKKNKIDTEVFQYYGGEKVEYTAILTYNLKDSIVDLTAKDKSIEFDSNPVYYKDLSKVIFPSEMNIVFPLKNGSQFKLYKYATYYNEDDTHFIKNNTDLGTYNFFFLYDGKGLFFFPDEVTLKINDKEYKNLGKMSYVSIDGGYTLIYYDTDTDTSKVIELDYATVTVEGKNITVNISERYFLSFSNKVLLMSPNNLNPV